MSGCGHRIKDGQDEICHACAIAMVAPPYQAKLESLSSELASAKARIAELERALERWEDGEYGVLWARVWKKAAKRHRTDSIYANEQYQDLGKCMHDELEAAESKAKEWEESYDRVADTADEYWKEAGVWRERARALREALDRIYRGAIERDPWQEAGAALSADDAAGETAQQKALRELTRLTEEMGLYEWQCKRCKGTGKEPGETKGESEP